MTWQTQPNMRIGVLALQGAFIEHAEHLERLKAEKGWGVDELEVVLVKTKEELEVSLTWRYRRSEVMREGRKIDRREKFAQQ